jgi:hypothetical protein
LGTIDVSGANPVNDDDSDPDLNDVAYIGNEDDERGPGCLIGIAITLALAGLIGLLIAIAFSLVNGLFAGAGPGGGGALFGYGMLLVAGIFGLFGGGAGIGTSLKAVQQSRQIGGGNRLAFAWTGFGLSLVTLFASFSTLLFVFGGWIR